MGPLSPEGLVAPWRQTRLGWFLVSAYGALARIAAAQALLAPGAGAVVMHAASVQAAGVAAGVLRAAAWQPDLWAGLHLPGWEMTWLPRPVPSTGVPADQAFALDLAALGLAIVTVVRPAPLLPADADRMAPFAAALALAEVEGGRLLQPFLRQVQGMVPAVPRDLAEAAVERRRDAVRALWQALVDSLADR